MSYLGISIREAMEKINNFSNGWYLPQVQRQYVWGARYGSETYIYMLLDSLYRRYPIGGLVLWETDNPVPFREFINDYYYYVKFILTFDNTFVYPLGYETPRDRTIPVEAGGLLG